MAKRKKKAESIVSSMPMSTPKQRRKWAAESTAHTMMETDPRHKKMVDMITSAVMKAGEKAMRKGMK